MSRKKIIIAGAGISGLVAGRLLLEDGHDVTILEGRERSGGRILTLQGDDFFVEAGPEFIHGRLEATLDLLKVYDIGYVETTGRSYQVSPGKTFRDEADPEGWDEMLKEMGELSAGISLADFLNQRFPGDKWRGLRAQAAGFASGFDLADPVRVSARSVAKEWQSGGDPQYRMPEGYGRLIASLEADIIRRGGRFIFDTIIERMDWSQGETTFYSRGKKVAYGDLTVFTIPVAVIQQHPAPDQLLPRLPEKISAAGDIGVGSVIKFVTQWKEPFWETGSPEALFFFGAELIPTWWTNRPLSGHQLTGWLGGPAVDDWSGTPKETLFDTAIKSLAGFSGCSAEKLKTMLKAQYVFDWALDPLAGGAYSYTLAAAPQAREIWARPVEHTLYFAGEGCHAGAMIGTVEAAVLSAEEAVRQIRGHHGRAKI